MAERYYKKASNGLVVALGDKDPKSIFAKHTECDKDGNVLKKVSKTKVKKVTKKTKK